MNEIETLKALIKQYEENEKELMLCLVAINEAYREKLIPETREQEQALHHTLAIMDKVLKTRKR